MSADIRNSPAIMMEAFNTYTVQCRNAGCFEYPFALFPHHSWAKSRIVKRLNERRNQSSILRVIPSPERTSQRFTERKVLDALGSPIGGNLSTCHTPHLF